MSYSPGCVELVKDLEHIHWTPPRGVYRDCSGVVVIGWGHAVDPDLPQLVLSKDQTDQLLVDDLDEADRWLKSLTDSHRPRHQWDALVAWAYHVLQGRAHTVDGQKPQDSVMASYIKDGLWQLVAGEFDAWTFYGGKHSRQLAFRRQQEATLYVYGDTPLTG